MSYKSFLDDRSDRKFILKNLWRYEKVEIWNELMRYCIMAQNYSWLKVQFSRSHLDNVPYQ